MSISGPTAEQAVSTVSSQARPGGEWFGPGHPTETGNEIAESSGTMKRGAAAPLSADELMAQQTMRRLRRRIASELKALNYQLPPSMWLKRSEIERIAEDLVEQVTTAPALRGGGRPARMARDLWAAIRRFLASSGTATRSQAIQRGCVCAASGGGECEEMSGTVGPESRRGKPVGADEGTGQAV